ncbi:MAG: hypothetical protein JO053_01050 [Acidobacteria bacterium]|nr:hypothetical protein [Acidobacteriota bacterium]
MKTILASLVLLIAAGAASTQVPQGFDIANYGVSIQADRRLIAVLATLEMASTVDADGRPQKLINTSLSDVGAKFRDRVIADNANLPEDLRRKITGFVATYKKNHPRASDAETVAPFMSMAYTLSPAPELNDPVAVSDLPGNLLDVLDFAPLVREFYRRSSLPANIDSYVKDYASDEILNSSAREMVSDLLDYLHTRPELIFTERVNVQTTKENKKKEAIQKTEIREHQRHFYIVPEKLAPKGAVTFLNVRDDYYVIVPPGTDLSASEARRAFLQFVIDPLVLKNAKDMTAMRDWVKPILDEQRKNNPDLSPDVFLAMTRSLVAAIDARQTEFIKDKVATEQARAKILTVKTDVEKRAVSAALDKFKQEAEDEATLQLYEDYQKGAVLSFYFAVELKGVEESGFDIASSLKDIIGAFDAAKEKDRIASTAESRKRALAARAERKNRPIEAIAVENPVTKGLLDIQKIIDAKDYPRATSELKKLLAAHPGEPRIYFNIARVARLSAVGVEDENILATRLLEAKTAYSNVLSTATAQTDPGLISLTYVELGRIYEVMNQDEYAIKLYDKAIQIGDVSGGAFKEAMAAKQRLLKP